MTPMGKIDDEEREKLQKRLRSYTKARNEVRGEMATLKEKDDKLGAKIREVLEKLDVRSTVDLFPKLDGYRLDRPQSMVFNNERFLPWLEEKVDDDLFERIYPRTLNKKALDEAVQAGDIDGIDDVLADEDFVTFKEMGARLMPTKAAKS